MGEGEAGLELLRRLPVDFVKISGEVIARAKDDESARALLPAVVALASQTGAYVIAEGVEDPAMLALVQRPAREGGTGLLGARGGQGWFLGHPEPSVEARQDWPRAA